MSWNALWKFVSGAITWTALIWTIGMVPSYLSFSIAFESPTINRYFGNPHSDKRIVITGVVVILVSWILYRQLFASRTPATVTSGYNTTSTNTYTKPTALHEPPSPSYVASTKPTALHEPPSPSYVASTKPTALYEPAPPSYVASTKSPTPTDSGQGIFTSFDPGAYRAFLRGLSDAQLRKKENSKMCAEVSGMTSLGGNISTTILTGGLLSPFVLLSARKMYLTESKLPLIREELTQRGMPHGALTSSLMAKGLGKSVLTGFVGETLTS